MSIDEMIRKYLLICNNLICPPELFLSIGIKKAVPGIRNSFLFIFKRTAVTSYLFSGRTSLHRKQEAR
jgi:ABC-type arginine transport system permease subunit